MLTSPFSAFEARVNDVRQYFLKGLFFAQLVDGHGAFFRFGLVHLYERITEVFPKGRWRPRQ